jgi:hypothetical protein
MIDMLATVNRLQQFDDELPQADSVLPVQFHNGRAETATAEPIRRLMVAVLFDAIRCFQTKLVLRQPAGRREFAEVRSWIFSEVRSWIFSDDDDACFSFRAHYAGTRDTRWKKLAVLV